MVLSRVSKKRLSSSARMVKNTRTLSKEMVGLNIEYTLELEGVITTIQRGDLDQEIDRSSADGSLIRSEGQLDEKSSQKSEGEEGNPGPSPELPPKKPEKVIPIWAKEIWREIMKHCHPDKIDSQKLSIEDQFLRKNTLEQAINAYEGGLWDEILYLGVMLDKFTDNLSAKKQLDKFDSLYDKNTKKIHDIQNSISWNWGCNWEDLDSRINILKTMLLQRNIPIPARAFLIKAIVDLEL